MERLLVYTGMYTLGRKSVISYILSESSLAYHEYVDWCYGLFNYEQMEDLLKSDKIEVIFIEE